MIGEERDPAWWSDIAGHPEVAPHVFGGGDIIDFARAIERPDALPLRSENGGILFVRLEPLGSVWEMHTLYRPEGWGREVAEAAPLMMERVFEQALAVTTYEQQGYYRSRPPRSHGWKRHGEPKDLGLSRPLIGWLLTRDDWLNAPARRRMLCRL